MVSPFGSLVCLLMSIFFELSCRNFNLLCRIHFFRETVGRVQNIFLQKMCYCAEYFFRECVIVQKLHQSRRTRRSVNSSLIYIRLGDSMLYVSWSACYLDVFLSRNTFWYFRGMPYISNKIQVLWILYIFRSFEQSIVRRRSCSAQTRFHPASVVCVLRSIFMLFSWALDKCFTN